MVEISLHTPVDNNNLPYILGYQKMITAMSLRILWETNEGQ